MRNQIKQFFKEGKDCFKQLFSKKWYKQIPNILTFSRGISPIIVIPLVLSGNLIGSVITLGCFAFTDFLDGLIARKFNLYSEFGRKLDAVCDKIFGITLLLPVISMQPISLLFVAMESIIASINMNALINEKATKSNIIGKCKTWALSSYIILNYLTLFVNVSKIILDICIAITTSLECTTIGSYIGQYKADDENSIKKDNIEVIKKDDNEKDYSYQNMVSYEKQYTEKPKVLVKKYNNKRIK